LLFPIDFPKIKNDINVSDELQTKYDNAYDIISEYGDANIDFEYELATD